MELLSIDEFKNEGVLYKTIVAVGRAFHLCEVFMLQKIKSQAKNVNI
jgi:hypothetical protein